MLQPRTVQIIELMQKRYVIIQEKAVTLYNRKRKEDIVIGVLSDVGGTPTYPDVIDCGTF